MERPWIKLFHTPLGHYIYDVGTNEILAIDQSSYRELDNAMKKDNWIIPKMESQAIKTLYSNGYLQPPTIQKVTHSSIQLVPTLLSRQLQNLTLQVTLRVVIFLFSMPQKVSQKLW